MRPPRILLSLVMLASCADLIGPNPYASESGGGGSTATADGNGGSGAGDPNGGSPPAGGGGAGAAGGQGGDGGEPPLGPITSLDVGSVAACAVRDGGVYCWGKNELGILGVNDTDNELCPPAAVAVSGLDVGMVEVDLGENHACARKTTGAVWCWGHDGYGQVNGSGSSSSNAVAPYHALWMVDASSLAVGGDHSCMRKSDGSFHCWGRNNAGQAVPTLGGSAVVATEVPPMVAADRAAAGPSETCLFGDRGSLDCFGLHEEIHGRTTTGCNVMNRGTLSFVEPVEDVVLGREHACVLFDGGVYDCWGRVTGASQCTQAFCEAGEAAGCVRTTGDSADLIATTHNAVCIAANDVVSCTLIPPPAGGGTVPLGFSAEELGLQSIRLLAAGGDATVCASDGVDVVCWSTFMNPIVNCSEDPAGSRYLVEFPR